MTERVRPTLRAIASVFARYANTTFGGGSATIAVLRAQIVDGRAWLDVADFDLAYALSRLTPGTNLLDPSLAAPANTGVGVHIGVLDGALHALWRGNYFAMTVAGSQLGGNLPAGITLDVTTRLPPVAFVSASATM